MISQLLWLYRRHAEERGVDFDLSREEFTDIILQNCYLCGAPPSNRRTTSSASLSYNGIDRVDNTLGYQAGNVMPCCKTCNSVKSKMSLDELRKHLRKMLRGLAT